MCAFTYQCKNHKQNNIKKLRDSYMHSEQYDVFMIPYNPLVSEGTR